MLSGLSLFFECSKYGAERISNNFSPRKAKIEASFEPACRLCRVSWNFSYPLSDRD
jgi:hypothetical protein